MEAGRLPRITGGIETSHPDRGFRESDRVTQTQESFQSLPLMSEQAYFVIIIISHRFKSKQSNHFSTLVGLAADLLLLAFEAEIEGI